MPEENEAIVRRLYEQVDEGNLAIIDQLVAADFIAHYPGGQDIHGPEDWKQFAAPFYAAFPDLQHIIEDIVAEGDKIVGRFNIRATHKGEFMGIAPTNQQVTLTEIAIFRIADGKLAEAWVDNDVLGLLRQLGAIPEPGQAREEATSSTRRIVTGHAQSGKSVFVSDSGPPRIVPLEQLEGLGFVEIWGTDGVPVIPADEGDPIIGMSSFVPAPEGTRFRIVSFPPDAELGRALYGLDLAAVRQQLAAKLPGLGDSHETEDPGMHTTDTMDYDIVLSGEITLELDDGTVVHLKQGDCVVQNGTRHAWRNRSSAPCVMACVMVGARRC